MKFKEIVDDISSIGRRKTDPIMVEIALLYYGAILFNRYDYKKDITNLKYFVNMYAMMFGSSSSGKSFIISKVESLCGLETLPDQFQVMYEIMVDQEPGGKMDKEIQRFMPTGPTVSLDGTKEGIFEVAKSVSAARFGSLNLMHDEFLDIVTSSGELLNMLKMGYDGRIQYKVIKGEKGDSSAKHVDDIVVNMMGAGSKDSVDKDTQKALSRLAKTGMYRRSIIVDSKMLPEKNDRINVDLEPVKKWFKQIDEKHKKGFKTRVDNIGKTGSTEMVFPIDDDAREYIEVMDEALMDRSNSDQLNPYKKYDVGSLNVIVNCAYIISYMEGSDSVCINNMKHAWEIFIRTRETTLDTFRGIEPHIEIYDILKKKPNLTHSDLMGISSSDSIPKSKNAFKDTMLLVQELAYRHNEVLKRNNGIVERYSIEDLPVTNLDKLIFSLSTDDKRQYAISFEPVELRWRDLEKLATSYFRTEVDEYGEEISLGVESFTLSHYDPSSKTDPYGHRRLESFVQGQNMIAFDMDDGKTTISEIKEKFIGFKYLIYTTKSHNTIKGDYCDRFRIVIPCLTKFFVNPEEHKILYRNIADFFDIYPDIKAYNVSRLLYTNETAEIYINDTDELFDIQSFLPDTLRAEELIEKMKNLKEVTVEDDNEVERRIRGFIKYTASVLHVGNLKDSIYRTFMFIKDLTGDEKLSCDGIESLQSAANFPQRFIDQFYSDHRIGK